MSVLVAVVIAPPVLTVFVTRSKPWKPLRPRFDDLSLEEFFHSRQGELYDKTQEVIALGFEPVGCTSFRYEITLPVTQIMVLVHRGNRDSAIVVRAGAPWNVSTYVEYATEFGNHFEQCTNNSHHQNIFCEREDKAVYQFSDLRDTGRLYLAHRRLLDARPHRSLPVLPSPGSELDELKEGMAKEILRQAEFGYFKVDPSRRAYRYTWKGAFLFTLKLMWPVGTIRNAMARDRAKTTLQRLAV